MLKFSLPVLLLSLSLGLLVCSAEAAQEKSAGGWPAAYKIMASVSAEMGARDDARERLAAAVTPVQFYTAVANVARLYEHDAGTSSYLLRNFDVIIASSNIKDAYLKPLAPLIEAASLAFRPTQRQGHAESQREFTGLASAVTMLSYALAESPVGSEEERVLQSALRLTSAEFFRSLQAVADPSTPLESVLMTLKPSLIRLVPEHRSRTAFIAGLKAARARLKISKIFEPSRRLGLPADTKVGWAVYGVAAASANIAALGLAADSQNPVGWLLAVNGGLAYLLGKDGTLAAAIDMQRSKRELRRSEKMIANLIQEPEHRLQPPPPPMTAQQITTALLGKIALATRPAATTCRDLFR